MEMVVLVAVVAVALLAGVVSGVVVAGSVGWEGVALWYKKTDRMTCQSLCGFGYHLL